MDYTEEIVEVMEFLEKNGFKVESKRGQRVLLSLLEEGSIRIALTRERSKVWNFSLHLNNKMGEVRLKARPVAELRERWEELFGLLKSADKVLRGAN